LVIYTQSIGSPEHVSKRNKRHKSRIHGSELSLFADDLTLYKTLEIPPRNCWNEQIRYRFENCPLVKNLPRISSRKSEGLLACCSGKW
jgi:hypothetical protein